MDFMQLLTSATTGVRKGRENLLEYFGRLSAIEEKFQAGLVSEADKTTEKIIFDYLKKLHPEMEYLGEETAFLETSKNRLSPHFLQPTQKIARWILDPLDGTTNYIHQFPIFCISLALEYEKKIQLAVIDVPILGETYTAIRGKGAFVNGRRLHVSKTTELKSSLLATGFFAEKPDVLEEQLKLFSRLVKQTRGIRRAGAAAFDLCMVARGCFDAFWEKNLSPWDTAAGILLVEEAGGKVSTYTGGEYNPYLHEVLATNSLIHQSMLKEFQTVLTSTPVGSK